MPTCNLQGGLIAPSVRGHAVLSVLISHAHRSLKFCGVHIYV